MRIAVAHLFHESNTFFSIPMTIERFREKDLHYGQEILEHWTGTCSEMGGFLAGAKHFGMEVIPIIVAWGMPAGPLTAGTFEDICGSLITGLERAGHLDGMLLALHGAMVAEGFPDADGEILRRVRRTIGARTPLVVTLDYHANVTEEMLRGPDVMLGYDTYPHVDQAERGFESAAILDRLLRNEVKPHMALARRPLLPHILCQLTESGVMADAVAMAHEMESGPGILCVSVAAGFPYCDVPEAGFTVYAAARETETARTAAEQIAEYVWRRRAELDKELPDAQEAVRQALQEKAGLTVLADVGDNLGAGTPGDGTILLEELLKSRVEGALVLLCDPEAVAQAIETGVRGKVRLKVGGKVDRCHGDSVEIEGVVATIGDGVFQNIGPMRDGVVDDQGRTAVLRSGGITVVLTERRMPMWNLQQLRSLGIEPTNLRIVVVKSAIAYRAAYIPIARRVIEVDTPGLAAANVRRFHYEKLRRPIFPLDAI